MTFLTIISVVLLLVYLVYANWSAEEEEDFRHVIEPELKAHGLLYISSIRRGTFKAGPFSPIEITIGKPRLNFGAILYDRTHIRKFIVKKEDGATQQVWAKIKTSWFKDPTIVFSPDLTTLAL